MKITLLNMKIAVMINSLSSPYFPTAVSSLMADFREPPRDRVQQLAELRALIDFFLLNAVNFDGF